MDEGHSRSSLRGAHALITGGGTGIGRGIATVFVERADEAESEPPTRPRTGEIRVRNSDTGVNPP